ncbi:hypothetical protein PUATCC27989T_01029 [Phytobacter ursingii]|nr:hypothetical protein PUATCC27989T_01029 [Phytobacter ursingii]
MITTIAPKAVSNKFDVSQKITEKSSLWPYSKPSKPYQDGFNFQFESILSDVIEFALYERHGDQFVIVDFFNSYDEACDEAKEFLDNHKDLKTMIMTL